MKLSDIIGWLGIVLILTPIVLGLIALAVVIARETHPFVGACIISVGVGVLLCNLALSIE